MEGLAASKRCRPPHPLIARLGDLQSAGFPTLAGASRKSFIGRTLAKEGKDALTGERLFGTLAAETALILKGAHIIRTHDVKASFESARVADAISRAH
jgi:dihydropteroate synthase